MRRRRTIAVVVALGLAGCASDTSSVASPVASNASAPGAAAATTEPLGTDGASDTVGPAGTAGTSATAADAGTGAGITTQTATSGPIIETTAASTTPDAAAAPTTGASGITTTTIAGVGTGEQPTSTPYGMPVLDGAHAGYAREHHDYPASDVFVPEGCGAPIISPVNGVILEARREDRWDRATDNPATRGGRSIAILGDDGVRYYLAHLSELAVDIEPGVRVEIGHTLGLLGRTGKAGACHVHVGISPPCPGKEWSVRRGVIWPWGYLDAWRRGEQLSPLPEVMQWVADHPDACAVAMADPDAGGS